eukprot:2211696-Pyramimonas_sp.AAC.1
MGKGRSSSMNFHAPGAAASAISKPREENCPHPGLFCARRLPNSARGAENARRFPPPPKRFAK